MIAVDIAVEIGEGDVRFVDGCLERHAGMA
jgi:hypothetical protein